MTNQQILSQKSFLALTFSERAALAQSAVRKSVERMHDKGLPTAAVDEDGYLYWHCPDGRSVPIEDEQKVSL
jgi:biotin operon repressor